MGSLVDGLWVVLAAMLAAFVALTLFSNLEPVARRSRRPEPGVLHSSALRPVPAHTPVPSAHRARGPFSDLEYRRLRQEATG